MNELLFTLLEVLRIGKALFSSESSVTQMGGRSRVEKLRLRTEINM